MKKKDYLDKVEKGVLIGTSALLISGFGSCSQSPTDMLEPSTTKGATGLPGGPAGPPGMPGVITVAPNTCPIIGVQTKYLFQPNESRRSSFMIEVPVRNVSKSYKYLIINQFSDVKDIHYVTTWNSASGIFEFGWKQTNSRTKVQIRPDYSQGIFDPFDSKYALTVELRANGPLYISVDFE